jgi:hypothetical protein
MKRAMFCCLFPFLAASVLLSQSNSEVHRSLAPTAKSESKPKAEATVLTGYGKLPLSFETNLGQVDAQVKFLSRTSSYTLFLTNDEAVLALSGKKARGAAEKSTAANSTILKDRIKSPVETRPAASLARTTATLRMKLRNANPTAKITGLDELSGKSNYFIGNDPKRWQTNVPTYTKVKYEKIYPGIDLVYYGNQRQLEYDFIVAPGADPSRIAFDVTGAKKVSENTQGDLVFKTAADDEIRWHKPIVYQEKDGARHEIAARYALTAANRVTFKLAEYDASRPLYIDPLIYSTYLGGGGDDFGIGIAVDDSGNAYVVGLTDSVNFPVTPGAFQTTLKGSSDIFITKFNAAGSSLVYSTYLGGSEVNDGLGVAVDSAGDAYITGLTYSSDFPTTSGALQPAYSGGQDGFVTKLNSSGTALIYSTYLGGSEQDQGNGIVVDGAGNAYVTGFTQSTDFPVTLGAFQTSCGNPSSCENAFVSAINPTGSALIYSTYLGGSYDQGYGISVDSDGNAYVTGFTEAGFPTTSGALQVNSGGGGDAFLTKVNSRGSTLTYSTYVGGSGYDQGYGVAIDQAGNAYITGFTESVNFPVTPGAFQTICNEGKNCARDGDAFVTEINPEGSAVVYSTYLGGNKGGHGTGIAVGGTGNAYVTGVTFSKNFPTTPGAVQTECCNRGSRVNAFMTRLNSSFSALAYSTYLRGIANTEGLGIFVDNNSNAYVTGYTEVGGFPVTSGAFQMAYGGGTSDAFVIKIDPLVATAISISSSPNPSTQGQPVTFAAVVTSSNGTPPNGETVSFMKGKTVFGTGTLSGGSASFTTSTLKVGTTTVKAAYGGDPNFAASTSKAIKQAVEKAEN